jgi:hypothetical protein
MKKRLLITLFLVILTLPALAKDQLWRFDNVTLTAGNWFDNYKQVQTSKSGSTQGFEVAPYFSTSIDYYFHEKWIAIPEIGWVVQREAGDDRISKNLFFIRTDAAYYLTPKFRLRAGTSLMILNISGNGGEATLPNGDSEETYYIPTERRTALNQTLDFGAEYIVDRISIRAMAYVYAWLDEEERMITYSTSLSYLIPLKELM